MREMLAVMLERRLNKNAQRVVDLVREFDSLRNDIYSPDSTEEQVINAADEILDIIEELNKL